MKENNPLDVTLTTAATFQINSPKFYASVLPSLMNDNFKFLANKKQEFKRKFFWNKNRSEIVTQQKRIIYIILLI